MIREFFRLSENEKKEFRANFKRYLRDFTAITFVAYMIVLFYSSPSFTFGFTLAFIVLCILTSALIVVITFIGAIGDIFISKAIAKLQASD